MREQETQHHRDLQARFFAKKKYFAFRLLFRVGFQELFFLTTCLQAGLENSRGGGFQLTAADGEYNAQALTGEDIIYRVFLPVLIG